MSKVTTSSHRKLIRKGERNSIFFMWSGCGLGFEKIVEALGIGNNHFMADVIIKFCFLLNIR